MDSGEGILTLAARDDAVHRATLRRLGEIDWDFPTQPSESSFSALHWHPCRFPSQIPAITIARLTQVGELILDPFMGSATTLVEAQRLGRRAIGIDINPISCLMARSKTACVSAAEVARYAARVKLRVINEWNEVAPFPAPQTVQGAKWYTHNTFMALRKLWGILQTTENNLQELGRAAFSSILLPSCREIRHWGYVCDNTTPKSNRETDARSLFVNALDRMAKAYADREHQLTGTCPDVKVVQGDAEQSLARLPSESCSAMVTSPPYFGVADYVKAQRLSMEWFCYEIEPLRQLEIGARSKRHRRNGTVAYLDELDRVFKQAYRVLRPGAPGVIIFGQSPSRKDCEAEFVNGLRNVGFRIELERQRQIPATRRLTPSVAVETVLVVRR